MAAASRIAVVTGSATGLGLETVRQLAARGHTAVLTARSQDKVDSGLAELGSPDGVVGRVLDVADQRSVDSFFEWLRAELGRVDVLVNNAGRDTGGRGAPLQTPTEAIAEVFDNNALSAWRMIQQALPIMNANGYGRVVNVSSGIGALTGMGTRMVPYRISKTALNAITRIASNEAGNNVKVNSVCPGWVRTRMTGPHARKSVSEGASGIVWAATLADDGPNGGFFRDGEAIGW
jgi:NAD(P)-dependent dehydrogenase (short-subunit alcohol dehydrogenase family)